MAHTSAVSNRIRRRPISSFNRGGQNGGDTNITNLVSTLHSGLPPIARRGEPGRRALLIPGPQGIKGDALVASALAMPARRGEGGRRGPTIPGRDGTSGQNATTIFPRVADDGRNALIVPGRDGSGGRDGLTLLPRVADAGRNAPTIPGKDGTNGRDGVTLLPRRGDDGRKPQSPQTQIGGCTLETTLGSLAKSQAAIFLRI